MKKKRIGILTGGGDCPGVNAALRAVTKTLINVYSADVLGIHDGFGGLVRNQITPLRYDDVSNILTLGGTILGTSNKDNFFGIKRSDSQLIDAGTNRLGEALKTFSKQKLDGLIVIGGDGSLTVAQVLHENGIPIVGIPKTIDNDVRNTDQTFGFDTACWVATTALDRLHSSALSHKRVMILEVMGRSTGWIALHSGIAGGGDIILIPEIPFSIEAISDVLKSRFSRGRHSAIVVVAEGSTLVGETPIWKTKTHGLSGISTKLATKIEKATGIECRATVLGHLQRGGTPTPFDRVLATRYGHAAAHLVAQNKFGEMVALRAGQIKPVSLKDVAGAPQRIPLDSPLLQVAKDLGCSFGE